jgi:hypothetical protein
MQSTKLALRTWLAAVLIAGSVSAAGGVPSLSDGRLAQGRFSSAHMLLEKTILKVDVLTVDIRFGAGTQTELSKLAEGKSYNSELGGKLAKVAIAANEAVVQLKFVRDVSLDQWMDGVRENLDQAKAAGLISGDMKTKVANALPGTFTAIKDRGYKDGDRLLYGVRNGVLETAVVAADGSVLLQKKDSDKALASVVLASYFAPGSDFREPLLKSLFK